MRVNLLLFSLGVWILERQANLPDLAWSFLIPPVFLLAMSTGNRLARGALVKACFLAAGFFHAAAFAHFRMAESLAPEWEGRDLALVGVVTGLPVFGQRGQQFEFSVQGHSVAPAKLQLVRYDDSGLPPVHAGEKWRFTVRLKRPHGTANPHGFDYEAWLLERGIRATGYVRGGARLASFVLTPSTLVSRARESLRERVALTLGDAPFRGVIAALLMGDQRAISGPQWQVFRRTGVIHLMSISGLHVTMIAALAGGLAYRFWSGFPALVLAFPARKAASISGLVAAFAYSLLAGYAVPTQRTVYMLAVVAVYFWRGRMGSPSAILCWAQCIVMLFDPWAVLSPGFWLSFMAVAFIMYSGSGRLGRMNWLASWGSTQWAVSVGLAPLLLIFFGQISIVSPLANAVAIPLVSFAVVPLTLLGALFPPLWELAHALFSILMILLEWLSGLPDAVWVQHAPLPWTVPLAFSGILMVLLPKGVPARWLGIFLALPVFMVKPEITAGMRLTVLDVGQGLSAVIQTPRHALLYDAGPAFGTEADSGNRIVLPYLAGEGIESLDAMVLSHPDSDHVGGAASVLAAIPVDRLIASFDLPGRETRRCVAGETWDWEGVKFSVLSPVSAGRGGNAGSCVLRIVSTYGSILLAGDIDRRVEDRLAASAELRADVLIVPHHGGPSAYSPDFLEAVSPRYAVFSAGYRNRFGHPRPEVVELYRHAGSALFRTDRDGALRFDFKPGGIGVRPWRAERRRYWDQEK